MLRDIFTNRWILGGLVLLIIVACACFLWYHYQLAPYRQAAADAQTLLEKWLSEKRLNAPNKQQEAPKEVEKTVSQRHPSDETQGAEYEWQKLSGPDLLKMASKMRQDELDKLSSVEKEALKQAVQAAFDVLSIAEQNALKQSVRAAHWAERGLAPPPPGYTYTQDQDGYHLVKYGEPHFRVTWDNYGYHNDHQLSDTEWEEYKALDIIANYGLPGPRQSQATPEIIALAKEWYDHLRKKTWGPLPGLSAGTTWGRRATQADLEEVDRLAMEKLNSLTPSPRSGVIDYTVVDRLLMELKAELERR